MKIIKGKFIQLDSERLTLVEFLARVKVEISYIFMLFSVISYRVFRLHSDFSWISNNKGLKPLASVHF